VVWAVGIALLGAVFVSLTKTVIQPAHVDTPPDKTTFFFPAVFVQGRLYNVRSSAFFLGLAPPS